MKLLGSTTSPYVRRIRLYSINISTDNNINNTELEFINLDIFNDENRALLTANNPAQKIPALIDNDLCVYDSGVIFRYLAQKFNQPILTWQQESLLTLIDAANDSMVSMLLLMRSGIDVEQDGLFFNLQRERVSNILISLNESVDRNEFQQGSYLAISLYCLLDWLLFRDLYHWQEYTSLVAFYEQSKLQKGISDTDPRNS